MQCASVRGLSPEIPAGFAPAKQCVGAPSCRVQLDAEATTPATPAIRYTRSPTYHLGSGPYSLPPPHFLSHSPSSPGRIASIMEMPLPSHLSLACGNRQSIRRGDEAHLRHNPDCAGLQPPRGRLFVLECAWRACCSIPGARRVPWRPACAHPLKPGMHAYINTLVHAQPRARLAYMQSVQRMQCLLTT